MLKLSLGKYRRELCDSVTRRHALRIGGTGLLGGLAAPSLIQAAAPSKAKAKACIFFMLEGGPSHIDMWDLKPEAPSEIRGQIGKIRHARGTSRGFLGAVILL